MSRTRRSQPGGHFEYSTKVYFFAPIGAYHANLSPEARARLGKANFEIADDNEPKTNADPEKVKKAQAVKSWIERHVFDGLQRLAADPPR